MLLIENWITLRDKHMRKNIFFLLLLIISFYSRGQTINQVGFYNVNGIHALSSKSNVVILGNGDFVSIANPSKPKIIGNISISGFSTSVLADENYAYFGTGMNVNLIIADISNPGFPFKIRTLSFPETGGGIFGLAKSVNFLYLAMGSDGIYSVDISNKTAPVVLNKLVIENGQARDVVVQAHYAFIAHGDGLKIIDIANPSNMQLIKSTGSGYNSIDIDGELVFLGKSSGGIDVFNISDPTNPLPVFNIPNSGGTAWDVKYHKNHVYLATDSKGLFIYKIEANSGIEMTNFHNAENGQSFGVCFQDSLVLLSGLINGVAILKYDSTGTVGNKVISTINQINFFPNPASDYILIKHDNLAIDRIKIYDINGKLIMQLVPNSSNERIDISSLPKGQYVFRVESNGNIISEKIIKVEL
jgi:hypothetical protein